MLLKSLKLKNFRSHKDFQLEINELTTLIIGENGSGKTSLLEAIFIVLRGKSFKAVDRDIVRRGESFYRVELLREKMDNIILRYNGESKEYEFGSKKTKRLRVEDKYPVILFEPNDLYLINSSPSSRRDYFDRLLSQFDESYTMALRKYNKALRQRNILLKNGLNLDNIFSWDVVLAKYGTELSKKRNDLVVLINKRLSEVYQNIAGNQDVCELKFCGAVTNESNYLAELNRSINRDSCLAYTNFGSHRDDYEFHFNHVNASGSASRGEIRSMILALKFIEAEIIKKRNGKNPVILLDDIFSELDEIRQKHLINNFKESQIIITSTAVPENMFLDIKL